MRVKFQPGQQRTFIEDVLRLTGVHITTLAGQIGVCERTVRDWRREKWQMDDHSLDHLCQLANLQRPVQVTLLPEHWSVAIASRIGGRRHFELYGSPATATGRSLGGRNAQKRFRSNPDYFRSLGIAVRKPVTHPHLSADLAELIGIMLGDGGMTNAQVKVSFNELDAAYADHVRRLITSVLGVSPARLADAHDHAFDLVVSRVEAVEVLESFGLRRGNKVQHQVDVPLWVWKRRDYRIACLRGLMDTDGCVYHHRYAVNGKTYGYCKLCFTSYSRPLLASAKRLFEGLRLFPTIHAYDGHRLYLHDTQAVRRYFEIVGTHNPRYQERFNRFSRHRGEVAEHGRLQLTANELGGQKLPPGFKSRPLRCSSRLQAGI